MGLFGTAKPVLVVDVDTILKSKGVRGRAAPRQQLQILRMLSRLVQREKIKVIAAMTGKPLDKAPHNRIFDGVRVRYAGDEAKMTKELLRALRQAGSTGVLVTENIELENKIIRAGGKTLRVSTFRKLIDDTEQQSGNGKNNGGNNENNRNYRNQRRNKKNRNSSASGAQPQQQWSKTDEEDNGGNNNGSDPISQMIDLVD
ncbi:MAG: hypothetical protein WC959_00880 [Kiritimatiellales bacterium]